MSKTTPALYYCEKNDGGVENDRKKHSNERYWDKVYIKFCRPQVIFFLNIKKLMESKTTPVWPLGVKLGKARLGCEVTLD